MSDNNNTSRKEDVVAPTMSPEDRPDLQNYHDKVLSDIRMQVMNGYEFVKKAKEIDKQVNVVLMSAFEINDEEFHNALSDINVDAFLQKPFSMWKLNDVIEKIIV
jgi:two-component SAPR family response regulator